MSVQPATYAEPIASTWIPLALDPMCPVVAVPRVVPLSSVPNTIVLPVGSNFTAKLLRPLAAKTEFSGFVSGTRLDAVVPAIHALDEASTAIPLAIVCADEHCRQSAQGVIGGNDTGASIG
jgi:hypothetical protein